MRLKKLYGFNLISKKYRRQIQLKMKVYLSKFLILFLISCAGMAQEKKDSLEKKNNKIYLITHQEGYTYVGKILSQDEKEIVLETKDMGKIVIPKYVIKSIKELNEKEVNEKGDYLPKEIFSTRYFITTNGLPIEKGESYIQWNLFGPDFQFGVGKNFGVGIMTSWVGMPIIGSAKYSIKLGEKTSMGLGALVGTGSWARPDFGIGLPFAAFTYGDRRSNINFSAGYGAVIDGVNSEGRFLLSGAGMIKIGKKISLVFDSFIIPAGKDKVITENGIDPFTGAPKIYERVEKKPGFALLIPGIRWQTETNKAFQFGFAGFSSNGEFLPLPIPVVQWYRKL